MKNTFLVGVDGSEESRRAARFAAERARAVGARLVLLHVVDWSGFEHLDAETMAERHGEREKEIAEAEQKILAPMAKELGAGLEIEPRVMHGHVAERITWLAREIGAQQVFVGRRGRGRFASLVMGSASLGLLQTCEVPLTIVP